MTSRSRQVEREIRRRRQEQQASLERNRKRLEQELRVNRERLADLNRQDVDLARWILRFTLVFLAIVIGLAIWIWAAGERAELEAQAAVLRAHRITDGSMYSWGPGVTPGQNQNHPILVPELPDFPPEDGEPPQAIEIRMATKAEAVPEERWESLGKWKLTAYCPGRCCNGRNAHRTASGDPMIVGDTVAVGSLPFGTKIKINDHVYTVTDRGVTGHHVDILFSSHGEARQFGVQYAEVFVLR